MNARSALLFARGFQALCVAVMSVTIFAESLAAEPSALKFPGKNEKLALWLKADSGVTKDAEGLVQRWSDQSGKANHASQTNVVSRPTWEEKVIHGQPALRFNGLTNFFEVAHSSSLVVTGGVAIFAVIRPDDVLTSHHGIVGKTVQNLPAPFDFYLQPPMGQPRFYSGDGSVWSWVYGNTFAVPNEWALVSVVLDGTNQTAFFNGAFDGMTRVSAALKDGGGSLRIGTRGDFGPWLKGHLAELLLFVGSISEAERIEIHKYLGDKYGLDVVSDISFGPPVIRRIEGQTASLSARTLATHGDVTYQWQKNGVDIPGATNAAYTTPPLTLAENGAVFRVRVSVPGTNRFGNSVTLEVAPDTEATTVSASAFYLGDTSPVASAPGASAVPPPYSSRFWPTGDDSPQNVIQAVTQTSDGMIWIGTAGGLARFDGEQFEFVTMGTSNRLARQKINVLSAGSDGSLWVGTAGQGLLRLRDGKWTSYSLEQIDPNILALHTMPDASLWIGTRKGMARVEKDNLFIRDDKMDAAPGPEKNAGTENVRSIARDSNGDLWIAAGDHLMRLNNGAVAEDISLAAFNPTYLRAVCRRRDGSLWLGSNSGLIRFENGKFTHFAKFNGLPDNVIIAVFEDSRGNLWIGTSAGLCRFVDGKFVVENTSDGEAYDQILSLFEDRENNVWVGTKNGLYQLRVQQFTTYTTRHGLAHNNIISVCEERDGTMWIGTWGGGLHEIRRGKMKIYSSAKNKLMRNDLILAVQAAKEGGVWFSADFDGGLYRLKDGEIFRYGTEHGFDPTAARALLEDRAGRLIIGTARLSVHLFENGRISKYVSDDTLTKDVRCVLQGADGLVWIGTEGGLVCKNGDGLSLYTTNNGLADNFVLALYEDDEQALWIGTAKGLNKMHPRSDLQKTNSNAALPRFSFYGKERGIIEDAIVEILEDDEDNLWLASRQGVVRIGRRDVKDLDEGRIPAIPATLFGRSDGMISPVCVGVAKPSALKSRDGRLWFATTKGLAVTDPKLHIARNETIPPVVIRELLADKRPLGGAMTDSVEVPPGRGELEFRYTALSYAAPERNRFKYRLIGFDRGWVDAGTRRTAFYNSVPPGSYQFQVIACNNDGLWNDVGSTVKLVLQPHYWQTAWFKGLIVFASFGFVGAMARYATWKKIQTTLRQLEQQHAIEKERTRIARDMHDELGARLTEIRVLSDLTEKRKEVPAEVEAQSRKISNAAGELIRNLHSIVWVVNPANDSLEKLADYLGGFAQPFLNGAGIRCRLERPDHLPDLKLSSEVRHNIVMVLKEALNNIVKHADASEVRISLWLNGEMLTVSVADDGKGFQVEKGDSAGNGLQNMERRMQSIDGRYELLTGHGKGTTIRFEIPLTNAGAN